MKNLIKKTISMMAIFIFSIMICSCGNPKVIDGVKYETYGLLNELTKNSNIEYEIIVGNVLWSIILCESIVFPVYFVGFSLYEPVRKLETEKFYTERHK